MILNTFLWRWSIIRYHEVHLIYFKTKNKQIIKNVLFVLCEKTKSQLIYLIYYFKLKCLEWNYIIIRIIQLIISA